MVLAFTFGQWNLPFIHMTWCLSRKLSLHLSKDIKQWSPRHQHSAILLSCMAGRLHILNNMVLGTLPWGLDTVTMDENCQLLCAAHPAPAIPISPREGLFSLRTPGYINSNFGSKNDLLRLKRIHAYFWVAYQICYQTAEYTNGEQMRKTVMTLWANWNWLRVTLTAGPGWELHSPLLSQNHHKHW